MKRYALKGINDDETTCSICGKVELKRVMWIVELDADGGEIGDPFPCGTTCGAKTMKQQLKTVNKIANSFESKKNKQIWFNTYKKENELGVRDLLEDLNKLNLRRSERVNHPLYIEMLRLKKQAAEWAKEQPFIIEFSE